MNVDRKSVASSSPPESSSKVMASIRPIIIAMEAQPLPVPTEITKRLRPRLALAVTLRRLRLALAVTLRRLRAIRVLVLARVKAQQLLRRSNNVHVGRKRFLSSNTRRFPYIHKAPLQGELSLFPPIQACKLLLY